MHVYFCLFPPPTCSPANNGLVMTLWLSALAKDTNRISIRLKNKYWGLSYLAKTFWRQCSSMFTGQWLKRVKDKKYLIIHVFVISHCLYFRKTVFVYMGVYTTHMHAHTCVFVSVFPLMYWWRRGNFLFIFLKTLSRCFDI